MVNADNITLRREPRAISHLIPMSFGSMPNDGGHLLLSQEEKDLIIKDHPEAELLIKRFSGSQEFIRGSVKYCLWISDDMLSLAQEIEPVQKRVNNCQMHRLKSTREATRVLAEFPHRFAEMRFKDTDSIIVPATSSERREYIPIGFLNSNTIISNSANAIYDAEPWVFSLVTSKMHMTWMRTVAGRLEERYRYSSALVYNTFPFPEINQKQKDLLSEHVFNILDEREKHSENTLAQLYDPDKMPEGLREAHRQNDLAIDQCYGKKTFTSDEERLEYLFKLYEEMIVNECR